ncbi:hypothetical protein D3C86_1233450 [compost metagenome]
MTVTVPLGITGVAFKPSRDASIVTGAIGPSAGVSTGAGTQAASTQAVASRTKENRIGASYFTMTLTRPYVVTVIRAEAARLVPRAVAVTVRVPFVAVAGA